ncbi:MAG TPA: divalent metal cation transporter, partial [Rheinheimera sp.]|nr:divalent metal cation transporter [Rheinheimera sp.]
MQTPDKNQKSLFGPATLVTAAFIGPGTVVTASLAGANYGYALIWALVFSVAATMVLQEMAARLGIVTGRGLGENLRQL